MTVWDHAAPRWVRYRLGLVGPSTQTTAAERACLARHAAGRRCLVELGVMHGVTTAVLRAAMAADGVVYGVDPHPPGRMGISIRGSSVPPGRDFGSCRQPGTTTTARSPTSSSSPP